MILALKTADKITELYLIDGGKVVFEKKWQPERRLAHDLLGEIESAILNVVKNTTDKLWQQLTGLIVYTGPGSFTGLRIGITTLNALADGQKIPIIGANGDNWLDLGLGRLGNNENDQIVTPEYGAAANITQPKK